MENIGKVANGVNVIPSHSIDSKSKHKQHGKPENKAHAKLTSKTSSTRTPPLKPPKKHRTEDTEILRCKRRLDFPKLGLHFHKPNPATVLRRNERERKRVKQINLTFVHLRDALPELYWGNKNPVKVSKVDTLRAAIDYINNLQSLIDDHDGVASSALPTPERTTEHHHHHQQQQQQQQQQQLLQQLSVHVSNQATMTSPGASSCTSSQSSETQTSESPLSPEEQELLDFASWFH